MSQCLDISSSWTKLYNGRIVQVTVTHQNGVNLAYNKVTVYFNRYT
jgi:hypothetical protein